MTDATDRWVLPGLTLLADWSIRWGVLLLAVALWLALRPPRRAATRHLLCALALAAGLFLPLVPRWGSVFVPWPSRWGTDSAGSDLPAPSRPLDATGAVHIGSMPTLPPGRESTRAGDRALRASSAAGLVRPAALSPALGAWRLGVLVLAVVWGVVVIILAARLIGGRVVLRMLRGDASEVGDDSCRLLEHCRRALGLARPVVLATHPAVASPVAVGGRRPVVLVPPEWDAWPEAHRRACLLHELTHLARRDDWAKLAQELVRVPFFFHPLVRWLLVRLDRERELLCDEAVVALGSDPVGYAQLLLELARRPGRLLPLAGAVRHVGLPFLDRRTVAVRIERLLEDDMARTVSYSPSPQRVFLAVGTLMLVAALGVGGLQVRAVEPKAKGADEPPPKVEGPRAVEPDDLAGVVVDTQGKPIEGVEARAWHWISFPGDTTRTLTDKDGRFRLTKFLPGFIPRDEKIEVRIRKEGYESQFHFDRLVGQPGWVVVLENSTYFDGRVLAPDGTPAPGARIVATAKHGPAETQEIRTTEASSGKDGRYRLYVAPGAYEIDVRAAGFGVARQKATVAARQARQLDIPLAPGVTFVARAIDHQTGKPLAGVKLEAWMKPGIEGTTKADGRLEIRDVPPGTYPRFAVQAKGYTRWWSDACTQVWNRYQKDPGDGFQRNFDDLDFEVAPGMKPVTIELERGVVIKGRVIDPDGKPVAGATVAPARTGTGNSLTGDTRFSVESDAQGNFTMELPASGDRDYNLVVHDGKYLEWRKWANGVREPFRTKPGEEVGVLLMRLTRPATVRGRVVDKQGKPVANLEIRANAADLLENRYYVPSTKTGTDGTYELRCVRPGEQFIQIGQHWMNDGPAEVNRPVSLAPGETLAGVDFVAPELSPPVVPPGRQ